MSAPLLATSSLLVGAGILSLGVWVGIRERWKAAGLQLAGLCLVVATWLFCSGMMLAMESEAAAEAWGRASYLGAAFVPAAVYQFTARLLRRHRDQHLALAVLWAFGLAIAVLSQATDLVVDGVRAHPWGWYTHLAPTAAVMVALCLAVLLAALALFAREDNRHEDAARRRRARAFAGAIAVGALGAVDFAPSFGWGLLPLGFAPVACGLALAARAVRRHQLVDVTPAFAADKILQTLQGAVLVCDLEERVRVANPAACTLLGYRLDELRGLRLAEVIESPRAVGLASDTLLRAGAVRERAMVWRRRGGKRVEVAASVAMMRDELGVPAGMVFVADGIEDRDRAAQIAYQAFHDPLTGLPNRAAFGERLATLLAASSRRGSHAAVLFFDLDGFKLINDALGHSAGDRVLQTLGRRLRGAVREGDLVCRFGGDEFTVLLEVTRPGDAEAVAQKLLTAVAEPFMVEGQRLYVTASIGVAQSPTDGDDAEALLRNADAAMYHAKELGRNNYQLCGAGVAQRAQQRLRLEAKLRQALGGSGLALHYQPVLELAGLRVVGAEALLRWTCDGEVLAPESFLPMAEETLLIRPLGDWVLRTACCQGAAWQERLGGFRVGVNLSARQLTTPGFVETLQSLLDLSGLPPQRLELEITESVAMKDPERTRELLAHLKELGVGLALDDFGTGYSSLAYLQQFPLDTVKIDRGFVAGLGKSRGGLAIIRATVAMANALGLQVTAEGVETPLQLELLRELGCHRAQGFGLGRPLPGEELERSLQVGRRFGGGERPLLQLDTEAATRARAYGAPLA
jgi:diguanylate cyclase (GGDEF)-like protein/PAS domain S-box-containing protein